MTNCPHHKVRADLPPLTPRIAKLPVDERGYPIPFFVAYVDDKPEFRAGDGAKFARCVKEKLCWVCGEPLEPRTRFAFTIGPMCAINLNTSEPPEHEDCAEWSVKGCPFLSKPKMVRREGGLPEDASCAGLMIERNPGVTLIWVTYSYQLYEDPAGGYLFRIGPSVKTSWWREGRPATRAECLESIESGLPFLLNACDQESDADRQREARASVYFRRGVVLDLLPKE